MNPCELNAAIAAMANHLYATLSPEDFVYLNVILSELSKTMFSMDIFRNICYFEKKEKNIEKEVAEEEKDEEHDQKGS